MPCAAWSMASDRASWISAPLVAQYAGRTGRADTGELRGDQDHAPPTARDHRRQRRLDHQERPGEVDPHRAVPRGLVHLQHRGGGIVVGRAVHGSTSSPPKRATVAATAARQLAPSVTSSRTGSAWPPAASMSAAVVLAAGLLDVGAGDRGAGGGVGQRGGASDAVGRANDQGDLLVEGESWIGHRVSYASGRWLRSRSPEALSNRW